MIPLVGEAAGCKFDAVGSSVRALQDSVLLRVSVFERARRRAPLAGDPLRPVALSLLKTKAGTSSSSRTPCIATKWSVP